MALWEDSGHAAAWVEEPEAPTAVGLVAVSQEDGQLSSKRNERARQLHEVRIPDGAVERCRVCGAAVANITPFCLRCVGLGLDVQPETAIQRLQREAAERAQLALAAGASDADESGSSDDDGGRYTAASVTRSRGRGRSLGRQRGRGSQRGVHSRGRQTVRTDASQRRVYGERLGYVDDVSVLEADRELRVAVDTASERVSSLSQTCRVSADQSMNPRKCVSIIVQPPDAVGDTTEEDVRALGLEIQCECGEAFASTWGLRGHKISCQYVADDYVLDDEGDQEHDVEDLVDVHGPPDCRFWRVKWRGVNPDGSQRWPDRGAGDGTSDYFWLAEEDIGVGCVELQNKFWRVTGLDRRGSSGPVGEHRCPWCNRMLESAAALKAHMKKPKRGQRDKCRKRPRVRSYRGTEVDRLVQERKRAQLLHQAQQVSLEGDMLKNEIEAEYLGTVVQGDADVLRRLRIARSAYSRLKWAWRSKRLGESLKIRLFVVHVLSTVVWGHEGWTLTKAVERKLNGWCARCMAALTGKSVVEESRWETQTLRLPGLVRQRRLAWLGHILRSDPASLTRQAVLRLAEMSLRRQIDPEGSILMDAPAFTSVEMLVYLAGGSGGESDRKENRKRWREVGLSCLCPADVARRKGGAAVNTLQTHNTSAEFRATLASIDHALLLYTDGGADGNGACGEWGSAGFGVSVREVGDAVMGAGGDESDEEVEDGGRIVAELYGPIVSDRSSPYYDGATRGTNQIGELTAVIQALLWLRENAAGRAAVVAVDSVYAANQTEGWWKKKASIELIATAQQLLAQVRESSAVTFVHVRGHTGEEGNERADRLVQWGKTAGPYSRLAGGGVREGGGLGGRVDGHLRKTKLAGEKMLVELVLGEGDDDELVRQAGEEGAGGAEEDNDRGVWEELMVAMGEISLDSEDEGFSSGLEA